MRTNLITTKTARLAAVAALAAGAVVGLSACDVPTTPAPEGQGQQQTTTEDTAAKPEADKADEAKTNLTAEAAQAVRSAESYLASAGFSKSGLIDQLAYEGFTKADAKAALKTMDIDWMAEAVESAKGYLESAGFSRQGLLDQLDYEGFTPEQAEHGVTEAGL